MISLFNFRKVKPLETSSLHTENDFYENFLKDLRTCNNEVIIESPYITSNRMEYLLPVFQTLLKKGIKIHLITRDPAEHEIEDFRHQATNELLSCKEMGINIVLMSGFHHRKLAIIDRAILWEGSLNILSHSQSMEMMRRIEGSQSACEMFNFLRLERVI